MRDPWLTRSVLLLVLCLSHVCRSQSATPQETHIAPAPSARFPAAWYPPDSDVSYTSRPQLDAPYSAILVTTEHLFDPTTGEDNRLSQSTFQARDGFGRKREEAEMPRPDGHGGTVLAHEVSVSDPVTHCSFRWMEPVVPPDSPWAIVTCMSRTMHYDGGDSFAHFLVTAPQQTQTSSDTVDQAEPLGERTFGDLKALGVKRTRTVTRNGEIQKLVTELWYSPELKEMLLFKEIHDPGSKQPMSQVPDFELTRIERGEPKPDLFYPPAGYDIKPDH